MTTRWTGGTTTPTTTSTAPNNPNGGGQPKDYGLSNIKFCFDRKGGGEQLARCISWMSRRAPDIRGASCLGLASTDEPQSRSLSPASSALPLVAFAIGAGSRIVLAARSLRPSAEPRSPILPDLTMPELIEFFASVEEEVTRRSCSSRRASRTSAPGPFIVHAVRGDERGSMADLAAIPRGRRSTTEDHRRHARLGRTRARPLARTDRRDVRDSHRPGGELVRRHEKVGYCFFDQAPSTCAPGCAEGCEVPEGHVQRRGSARGRHGALPGLAGPIHVGAARSAGRRDRTPRWGVSDLGESRSEDWFSEVDESNNVAWADVRLTTSARPPLVEVLRKSPSSACRKGTARPSPS